MSKPKSPKPPDPIKTAAGQTSTNIGTAIANAYLGNYDQVTPEGTLSYNQTGEFNWYDPVTKQTYTIPRFTMAQELSPEGEQLRQSNLATQLGLSDFANEQVGRLSGLLGRPFNLDDIPPGFDASTLFADLPEMANRDEISTGLETRARVEEALMSRLNPQLQRDEEALRTRLANQGIKLGSTAFDRGLDQFTRQSNDARMAAILAAGEEGRAETAQDLARFDAFNRQRHGEANLDLSRFNVMEALRNRNFNELLTARNQPLNEIIGLLSGSQVQQPNFRGTPVSPIATTDYAGIMNQDYQNRYANYQADLSARNQMLGGLFSLGAAGIGAYPFI